MLCGMEEYLKQDISSNLLDFREELDTKCFETSSVKIDN